jgi:hypothetical protein
MGAWAWFVGAAAVGAAIGYIGFFARVEGWSGALMGALIGLGAAALQQFKERSETLGPKRAKAEPVLAASGAGVSPDRNRRILWRRSKPAVYSRWLFFFAGIAALFFGFGWLIAKPHQFGEIMAYGLVPLGLIAIGIYKRVVASRDIARALRVLERGVVGEARLLSLDHEAIKDNKSPFQFSLGWIATYGYRDGRGVEHAGTSGFLPRKEAERYHPGDIVTIVVDPADTSFSVWAEPCSRERAPMISGGRLSIV